MAWAKLETEEVKQELSLEQQPLSMTAAIEGAAAHQSVALRAKGCQALANDSRGRSTTYEGQAAEWNPALYSYDGAQAVQSVAAVQPRHLASPETPVMHNMLSITGCCTQQALQDR